MTAPKARIVYFGTPQVAVAPLVALQQAGHEIVLVVTRPPRRRGRGAAPTLSPVGLAAGEMDFDVTWDTGEAAGVAADVGVVVAFGELIGDEVLRQRRTVNLHFSLLPRWRGAAPVERAILAGDPETGVCLMEVVSELDAGAVHRRADTPIGPHETAEHLRARLCELGIELLLGSLAEGFGTPQPQSGTVTWADKMSPSELRIDWAAPAEVVLRLVRVGGAWTTFRGRRLKVLAARSPAGAANVRHCIDPSPGDTPEGEAPGTIAMRSGVVGVGAVLAAAGDANVELLTVQAEGRQASAAGPWSNGARLIDGERFDG